MDDFAEKYQKAVEKLKMADHLLTQTFSLVNDPKLLIAVLVNINAACELCVLSVLQKERLYKRITAFPESAESRLELFETVAKKKSLDEGFVKVAKTVYAATMVHEASPVEFARGENYVLCTEDYQTTKINSDKLKSYISVVKKMLSDAEKIIGD